MIFFNSSRLKFSILTTPARHSKSGRFVEDVSVGILKNDIDKMTQKTEKLRILRNDIYCFRSY